LIIAFPKLTCFYYPLDSHLQAKMLLYIVIAFFHHVYLRLTLLPLISYLFFSYRLMLVVFKWCL